MGNKYSSLKNETNYIYKNQNVKAYVYDVYDGDTCTLNYFVCKKCKKVDTIKVRLNNIDTPEIKRSSNLENRATVKVKEYVANLILNKYANVSNSRSMVEF